MSDFNSEKEKKYPKISIVTPSFNQGEFLEETILSIINQNYPNLEYIIIDGGSTDNSVEIIKKYDEFIDYWVSEKDEGQSHAIMKGLEKCTGDIFNWINSDDYLVEDSLFKIANYFKKETLLYIGYNKMIGPDFKYTYQLPIHKDFASNLVERKLSQQSMFYNLSFIKNIDFPKQLHYCMDLYIYYYFILFNSIDKIDLMDETISVFRIHSNSKTTEYESAFDLEANLIHFEILKSASCKKGIVYNYLRRNKAINSISFPNIDKLDVEVFQKIWAEYKIIGFGYKLIKIQNRVKFLPIYLKYMSKTITGLKMFLKEFVFNV